MNKTDRLYFKALFENDLIPSLLVNANYEIVDYNNPIKNKLPFLFKKEIKIGESLLNTFRSSVVESLSNGIERAFIGKKEITEFEVESFDEIIKYGVEVQFIPLVKDDGAVDCVCCVIVIKYQEDRNRSVQEKEERMNRLMANNASDVIWLMDENFKFEYVTPSVKKGYGYTTQEFLSLGIADICAPEDLDRVMRLARDEVSRFMQNRCSVNREVYIEFGVLNKEGKAIPSEITARIFKEPFSDRAFQIEGITRDVSHRKMIEEKLQYSQKKFVNLLSQISSIAIQGYKLDGTIVFWNKASERLYGYTYKEAIGENIMDLIIPPSRRQKEKKSIEYITQTGAVVPQEEVKYMRKNGSMVPVLSNHILVDAENGEKELFCLDVDLTAQKSAEKEWQKLSRVVEQSPDTTVITDTDGRIEYVNPMFFKLTGYSAAEVIGKSPGILSSGENPSELYKEMWLTITKGKVWKGEFVNRKKNGEIYYESAIIFPIVDGEGWISHFVANKKDITAEKQALKALRESEQKFRQLAENIEEVFFLYNNKGIFYVSPSFEEIFGIPVFEISKNPGALVEIILPEDRHQIEELLRKENINFDDSFSIEYRIRRRDGEVRWIHAYSYPVPSDGNTKKRAGLARDITERKQFERDLVKAKESAEKSDQLKEAFLRNISHEIRTPMNAILGFSDLISSGKAREENREKYLQAIGVSTRKLLDIVDNILVISKLESGNLKLNPVLVKLGDFIDELYQKHKEGAADSVIMVKECDTAVSSFFIDKIRLLSIMDKLMDNAMKFTREGTIKLGYKGNGDYIRFFVEDTGIGINEANLSVIFEAFRQLDSGENREYEGNGLGLTIAEKTARVLNTSIKVVSEPGKGSCFYFDLQNVNPQREGRINQSRKSVEQKLKLLIVDDEEYNAFFLSELIQSLFSSKKIEFSFAQNGKQAIEIFEKDSFDLVMMDVKMPEMDGKEAASLIKAIRPDLPVIAQTALVMDYEYQQIKEAGCDAYINKPIQRDKLKEILDNFLG